jgi:integrase
LSRRTQNTKTLTERKLRALRSMQRMVVWDKHTRNLAVIVQPSGVKTWYFVYSRFGRPRWYRLGRTDAIDSLVARKRARQLAGQVAEGRDPQSERAALNAADTFERLHTRYVNDHARKHNKSWQQADTLIKRYVLPRLGKLKAQAISRAQIKELFGAIDRPVLANQVLAAISAVFTWGEKQDVVGLNPCRGVDRNKTQSRARVLTDEEMPRFWKAFDDAGLIKSYALKILLLTGQRPGEVGHMRREHIKSGWWEMPGKPVPGLGWPGTKNARHHRVWLPHAAQELIAELADDDDSGFVFGKTVSGLEKAMRECCKVLKAERATPHDLRRTHGTMITKLGFGREAMNRIENHTEASIADVYDRHTYESEDKLIMETVANRIMNLVDGKGDGNVIAAQFRK